MNWQYIFLWNYLWNFPQNITRTLKNKVVYKFKIYNYLDWKLRKRFWNVPCYCYYSCQLMFTSAQSVTTLTHWGRNKMAAVSQTALSNAFSWMIILEFRLRFHWSLFLRVQLTIIQHWFRWWLGAGQATSHYLNQWRFVYWRIYASVGLNELSSLLCVVLDVLGDNAYIFILRAIIRNQLCIYYFNTRCLKVTYVCYVYDHHGIFHTHRL